MLTGSARSMLVIGTLVTLLLASPVNWSSTLAAEQESSPIRAQNAVVVEVQSGEVLYEKGMTERVAPASLTKIFTSIVALETAPLDSEMTVDAYDLVGEASIGLVEGETVTMETLLHGLMLTSGNDAAMTLARELGNLPGDSPQESVSRFIDRVNATAERLGLTETQFRNPHGLDQNGHFTSARDIASMTMYALDNPVFRKLISTPYYEADGRGMYNTNSFLDSYAGLIGGKTGVTDKAGYSLMQVAERDGQTVLVVLLGSDRANWYADAEYLLDLGFSELAAGSDTDERQVIGPATIERLDVPEVAESFAVGGNLTVDRLSDHEAVVRASSPLADDESRSWRWPLVSLGMMGVALVAFLNFPVLMGMGALALDRGSKIRFSTPAWPSIGSFGSLLQKRNRTRARDRRRFAPEHSVSRWEPSRAARDLGPRPAIDRNEFPGRQPLSAGVTITPARARAEGAIKLALQGRYHLAVEEFRLALEQDPDVDLTSCPGFWRMQPMGYISAAKAYLLNRQREEARRLLTVVQIAYKSNDDLTRLFAKAIRQIDE